MKPPFTSSQEMYNYAANQMINQGLSNDAVKNNLMEHGVTDADADIVIQNMMVAIQKQNKAKGATQAEQAVSSPSLQANPTNNFGSFASLQEMYNYAADQLIVKKLSQQTTKINLMNHALSSADADEVIKNMMVEINKNKPVQVSAKRSEGQKMLLAGIVIAGIGLILFGTKFNIAGQGFGFSYGLMIVGGILFFRGLFKMF
ncbi:MAG TPA: hypothetical protein VLJ68_04705 [Chitinophagaceae bacterium]|nr:hypothetical protein [Chitinophagaceae bacterium]